MAKRFFILMYVLSLIAIGLSLPVYLITNIQSDAIRQTTYNAKCLSNDQHVVLQGSRIGEVYTFNDWMLNDSIYNDTKKTLNFYCKYYDQIQPHIVAYVDSQTGTEIVQANTNFFAFKESVISNVHSHPALYKLEVVSEVTWLNAIYSLVIDWLLVAGFAFIILQIVRICYVYVVFGRVAWHPFKSVENK